MVPASHPVGGGRSGGNLMKQHCVSSRNHCRTIGVLFLSLFIGVFAAGQDTGGTDNAGNGKKKRIIARINTFFGHVPKFTYRCDDVKLHYFRELVNGIPQQKRYAFQQMRSTGGAFDTALRNVKKLRNEASAAHRTWLLAAMANFRAESLDDVGLIERALETADTNRLWYQAQLNWFTTFLRLYFAEKELREVTERYYTDFLLGADALSIAQQKEVIDAFTKRIECLRTHCNKIFLESYKKKILFEKGLREYVKKSKKKQDAGAQQNAGSGTPAGPKLSEDFVERINAAMEIYTLSWALSWLQPEYTSQLMILKKLLAAHEKKLRNRELHPLLEKAPPAPPFAPLRSGDKARDAMVRIARIRSARALLSHYLEEAKLRALYTEKLNQGFSGTAVGAKLIKDAVKAAGDMWKTRTFLASDAGGTASSAGFLRFQVTNLAIAYRFLGTTFTTLVTRHAKDALTVQIRRASGIDLWKTTAEEDLKTYEKQSVKFAQRAKFLEHLASEFTWAEGRKYVSALRGGRAASLPDGSLYGTRTFADLLEDYAFVKTSGGGLPHIFEVLCGDLKERAAVVLHGARLELKGSTRAGYSRVAAFRGVAVENPDRALERADLDLSVFKEWSDYYKVPVKLPVLFKNLVGEYFGEYGDQEAYLKLLVKMQKDFDTLLAGLAGRDINFNLDLLKNRAPQLYRIHLDLNGHCAEYAKAWYRIRRRWWYRAKLFNQSTAQYAKNGRARSRDIGRITATQMSEEMELTHQSRHVAYLKLVHFAKTLQYPAAAAQTRELEKLSKNERSVWKRPGTVDLSEARAQFEKLALCHEYTAVYEELFNKALLDTVVSVVSTRITEVLLSKVKPNWVNRFLAQQADKGAAQLLQTFNPWMGKFSLSGVYGVASSSLSDIAKQGLSEVVARRIFKNEGIRGKDIEHVVGFVWDVFDNVADNVKDQAKQAMAESCAAWYVDIYSYERALEETEAAWRTVKNAYKKRRDRGLEELEKLKGRQPDEAEYTRRLEQVKALLADDEQGQAAVCRYRLAYDALGKAVEKRSEAEHTLRDFMIRMPFSQEVRASALGMLQSHRYGEVARRRDNTVAPAELVAAMELNTRLALGVHTRSDIEALTDRREGGLGRRTLRKELPIEVIRSALSASLKQAEARRDDSEVQALNRLADRIDAIRIERIDSLIGEFMSNPDFARYADRIELIVQGGAAQGNPEYRGIFGDIDFTLFTKPGADTAAIKKALLGFFEKRGYPLAESVDKPSSMDSEAFVQPFEVFTAAAKPPGTVIEHLQEQRSDPTRFYTEGGTRWFINSTAYSGKVLWSRSGGGLPAERMDRRMGQGVAVDMTRYLAFLADPAYSGRHLSQLEPAVRREKLGNLLSKKGKYFLRLVDAYEIAHETGNKIYNEKRRKRRQSQGRDASYHYQIYRDAEAMVQDERGGGAKTIFSGSQDSDAAESLTMLRRLAEMKLKKENASPWDVFRREGMNDEQAVAAAQRMVAWMREKTPAILAHNADVWHAEQVRLKKSGDPADREKVFSSASFMISPVRNIGELEGTHSAPLLVPKALKVQGRWEVLSPEAHAALIRQRLAKAVGGEISSTEKLQELGRTQPPEDLDGRATRQKIDEEFERFSQRLDAVESNAGVLEERVFEPYVQYLTWMLGKGPQ